MNMGEQEWENGYGRMGMGVRWEVGGNQWKKLSMYLFARLHEHLASPSTQLQYRWTKLETLNHSLLTEETLCELRVIGKEQPCTHTYSRVCTDTPFYLHVLARTLDKSTWMCRWPSWSIGYMCNCVPTLC